MVTATTIKKGYKQTELGVIPEDWTEVSLSKLAIDFIVPMRDKPKKFGGAIPWCRIEDFEGKYLYDSKSGQYVDKEIIKFMNLKVYPIDTLLVSCSADLGRCAITSSPLVTNQTFIGIVFDVKKASSEFFYYYMTFNSEKLNNLSSGTTISYLSREQFESFKVKVPKNTEEQNAIVTVLSNTDALIECLEKLIAKKKAIKQGTMQQLLTGKKRLPGFSMVTDTTIKKGYKQTELGVIPEDWDVKMLGEIGSFSKGQGIKKDQSQSGELPCIRYGELYTRYSNYIKQYYSFISKEIAVTAKKMVVGDILFAGSGETKEEIGKCAVFIDSIDAYAGGDIVIFSPYSTDSLFLGYLLNSPIAVKQKASKGQGDAVVHISASNLKDVKIPVPPKIEEQTAIATILSDMDAEIESLEQKRDKYTMLKQGIMQQLLTGRIRIHATN